MDNKEGKKIRPQLIYEIVQEKLLDQKLGGQKMGGGRGGHRSEQKLWL